MSFQWLQMRISEENDRRRRERAAIERLPSAFEDLRQQLEACIQTFRKAFGEEAASIVKDGSKLRVTSRDERNGVWTPSQKVEIISVAAVPGFQVDRSGEQRVVEIGLLPGDKLYYRDRDRDQYISLEELTRLILDRVLFPKLDE